MYCVVVVLVLALPAPQRVGSIDPAVVFIARALVSADPPRTEARPVHIAWKAFQGLACADPEHAGPDRRNQVVAGSDQVRVAGP